MSDVFKPQSLTIKELFGNADALYQIPIYQRPYKWGREQVEKLWEDIWEAYESDQQNYFLGSIITAVPQDSSKYLDIVDGQQRLTTLLILFCCYRDMFPSVNMDIDVDDPDAVDINVLNSSILYNNKHNRLRLVTHSTHQSDFDNLIVKYNNKDHKTPSKRDLQKDEEPKFKFINTSCVINEYLEELDDEQAGKFLNFIFNKIRIIRIDCTSVNFAIKLFQVLNDRGLDLTNADLIKSFLLEKIYRKYSDDASHQKKKAEQFISDWRSTESIIKDSVSMNDLFVIYEYYLLAGNPKLSLYDELENQFKEKDSNEVIANFKQFAQFYKDELFDKEDKLIYSFHYLKWGMYWKSILLTALQEEYVDYRKLAILLRRYYYLNWIAGNTLTKIKQISFNIIGWVKANKPIDFIESQINGKLESDGVLNRARYELDGDIYNQPWCKALLCLIEYNQTDDSTNAWIDIWDRNLHVEHILPKKYSLIKEWNHFAGNEFIDSYINSGANLTLISGKKNIEASNNSFLYKMNVYKGNGKFTSADGKITSFRISQKIVDDFESNKFNKEWNWKSMHHRWLWFCEQVETILNIDLTSIKHDNVYLDQYHQKQNISGLV